MLEKLQQLLSPFRLPSVLTVKVEGCDGEINAWYDEGAVTVCYEYLDYVWQNAFKRTKFEGVAQIDVMLGPVFDVFLHEFGHALFHLLDVPLFGREEDAADQLSAYIMLHFGREEARRLILGTAYAYKLEAEDPDEKITLTRFADEHGPPAQRFYNLLCIAYGADAELFGDLVKKGYLPKGRAEGCEGEYAQVRKAFQTLITPHVDLTLGKRCFGSQLVARSYDANAGAAGVEAGQAEVSARALSSEWRGLRRCVGYAGEPPLGSGASSEMGRQWSSCAAKIQSRACLTWVRKRPASHVDQCPQSGVDRTQCGQRFLYAEIEAI